jgi:putative SOS response-associated peptidase YedK
MNARAANLQSGARASTWLPMCGRIIQSGFGAMKIQMGTPDDPRIWKPRYNGAPSQDLVVIRRHPKTGETQPDMLRWGLIPYWVKEANPKTKPINATAERVASAPMFKSAYAKRRCIVPVNGFFEWKAVKGAKTRQPYAIAMQDDSPFALAGIWENWQHPETKEWVRTFCIITTAANELVGQIHDRMPVIIAPESYERWLANIEPDPRDLLVPYPSADMKMWPISTRVNKPDHDDADLLTPAS